jgi:hypothetical protein
MRKQSTYLLDSDGSCHGHMGRLGACLQKVSSVSGIFHKTLDRDPFNWGVLHKIRPDLQQNRSDHFAQKNTIRKKRHDHSEVRHPIEKKVGDERDRNRRQWRRQRRPPWISSASHESWFIHSQFFDLVQGCIFEDDPYASLHIQPRINHGRWWRARRRRLVAVHLAGAVDGAVI